MIRFFLVFLFINISIFLFSQTNQCNEIKVDSMSIYINGIAYKINAKEPNFNIEKQCFDNYLIIICTRQNGNEYDIKHFVYIYEKNRYALKYKYRLYSNRQGHQLYGSIGDNTDLSLLNIENISDDFLLNESFDAQSKQGEIYKSFYSSLIKKNKYNVKILNLLGNPYIINNENMLISESTKVMTNLAFDLFKTKSYINSIYLSSFILKKYPTNAIAWLNLADAQWELGQKEEAKVSYQKYLFLIKNLRTPPKKVYERSK